MLTCAIILVLTAAVLFTIELFMVSGGMLAILSATCLVSGIVCLFMVSPAAGLVAVIVTIVVVPVAVGFGFKLFPNTPFGRRLILSATQPTGAAIQLDKARDENPAALLGAEGESVTHLRPVGICRINGKRLECMAESGIIDPGRRVVVTSVKGIEIKVRPI